MNAKHITSLLLALFLVPACDTGPEPDASIEDVARPDDPEEEELNEIEAGRVAAAQFGRPDDSEAEDEIDTIRMQTCATERTRDTRPEGFVMERARGLDEPGFRLEEDQERAARDLAPEDDTVFEAPPGPADGMSDAQARYVAEKDTLAPQERALRKEALLGE